MRMSTWMRLAIVALLAGCSFEPGALQPPGGGDGAPPLPPDARLQDAGIDAAPPDAPRDTDGDTVLDPDDNCPTDSNTDQADCDGDGLGNVCDQSSDGPDEDGDQVSNACDNCPSVANPAQENVMDDDAVGDACDPRPSAGGDTIAYFEGFDTDSEGPPPGWILATGDGLGDAGWRVESGALAARVIDEPSILYLSDVAMPDDIMIESRGRTLEFSLDFGTVASAGVIVRFADAANGVSCVLEQKIDTTTRAAVRVRNFAAAASEVAVAEWRVDPGEQLYRVTHVQHAAQGTCAAEPLGAQLPTAQIVIDDARIPVSGRIGVRVVRSGTTANYVLVYGLGGPLPGP